VWYNEITLVKIKLPLEGGERELKQTLKKINWLGFAQVIFVTVFALAPLVLPGSAIAQDNQLNNRINCSDLSGLNCESTSVNQLIIKVIRIMLGIAFGVAVLFLIIGGFYYITAQGNEESAAKGKQTVINALIGIVIIIMSYVIVNVIANLAYNSNNDGI
jgi:uncharacterized membrane protein